MKGTKLLEAKGTKPAAFFASLNCIYLKTNHGQVCDAGMQPLLVK
jgi:hypothetical protein